MRSSYRLCCLVTALALFVMPQTGLANPGRIIHGVTQTLAAPFEIPKAIINHSKRVIFPVGIVTGAVDGTVRTVFGVLGGVVNTAVGAAPYAKYAVLFI